MAGGVGRTPHPVVAERLQVRRPLVHTKRHSRAGADDIVQARLIVAPAKEVSQPDMANFCRDNPGYRGDRAVRDFAGCTHPQYQH
jgi:hypothetical protein